MDNTVKNLCKSRLAFARCMIEIAKKKLDNISIHTITPVLSDAPFIEPTPYLDIYASFSGEPMHILDVGVSRMLKEDYVERLRSTTHNTDQYRKMEWTKWTFASLRTAILRQVHKFWEEISR